MFVPSKHFQPCGVFESKTGTYSSGDFSGAPLYGRLLALPTNIRPDWKGRPGTNALAYYEHLYIKRCLHYGDNRSKLEVFKIAKNHFL